MRYKDRVWLRILNLEIKNYNLWRVDATGRHFCFKNKILRIRIPYPLPFKNMKPYNSLNKSVTRGDTYCRRSHASKYLINSLRRDRKTARQYGKKECSQ